LNGGRWNVVGGQKGDTFNLISEEMSGTIDGGSSEENSLVLGPDLALSKAIIIDLLKDNQSLNMVGGSPRLFLKDISIILGRTGQQETILCGSSTTYVDRGGGVSPNQTDLIVISGSGNEKRDSALTITVKGGN